MVRGDLVAGNISGYISNMSRKSMSGAQRKALAAHRRRRRDRGVVRVEVQVPEVDAGVVREVAAILRGEPVRAEAVRAQLRSAVAERRPGMSVFDIFGSDLPDHYFDGVFDQDRDRGKARAVEL
jgi:hypothetical protein